MYRKPLAPGVILALSLAAFAGCLRGDLPPPSAGSPDALSQPPPTREAGKGGTTPASSSSGSNATAHTHEYYWGGATELTVLNAGVTVMLLHNHLFDQPPRAQHTHGCEETLASTSQGGSVKFSLPQGTIVPPGAADIEFSFSWTDAAVTGVRFLYRPASEHDFLDAGRIENGQTLRLVLKPEMADSGHATRSQWGFFLCADSSQMPVNVAQGTIHVRAVAHRAEEVPLEPAHPDPWGERPVLPVTQLRWSGRAVSAGNQGDSDWLHLDIPHGAAVPPGTTTVVATVRLAPSGTSNPVDAGGVRLYYRDSSVPEWVYRVATASLNASGGLDFKVSVDENMADGVYAHESNWDFWLRLLSANAATPPSGIGEWGAPYVFEGSVAADVAAWRDPLWITG